MAAPFREAEFDILYGEGISREGDLLDLAVTHNIVEKSGAWFSYKGERIGQGRENARQFLKDNRDALRETGCGGPQGARTDSGCGSTGRGSGGSCRRTHNRTRHHHAERAGGACEGVVGEKIELRPLVVDG